MNLLLFLVLFLSFSFLFYFNFNFNFNFFYFFLISISFLQMSEAPEGVETAPLKEASGSNRLKPERAQSEGSKRRNSDAKKSKKDQTQEQASNPFHWNSFPFSLLSWLILIRLSPSLSLRRKRSTFPLRCWSSGLSRRGWCWIQVQLSLTGWLTHLLALPFTWRAHHPCLSFLLSLQGREGQAGRGSSEEQAVHWTGGSHWSLV